jgi:transcriptional regulator with PAS, ATPase and Fis domain
MSTLLSMSSRDVVHPESESPDVVVGHSAGWTDAMKRARLVAPTDATVLLQGESGTGKEVVARLIHAMSPRERRPFVAINCAALPENLLESELFGYERGAFTGAHQSKPGQVEIAAGGVLFLDEVSEMSLAAQAKFLRFLQERESQRLGGTRVFKTNVRIIAATNRDLEQAMARGSFRHDLYYRLQVFTIQLPPLRERQADILPLADAFLREISRSMRRPLVTLTQEATEALLSHAWPGNVRELHNALERAAIICEGAAITATHLSLAAPHRRPQFDEAEVNLDAIQRRTIARVLGQVRGNKSQAAKRLGLTRNQLYERLRKYNLESPAGSFDDQVDLMSAVQRRIQAADDSDESRRGR